jgi:hypothetical protein
MSQTTMYAGQVNSRQTEIAVAITAAVATISVLDASVLPAAPNIVTIGSDETAETILYTGKTGNDLTGCTRGFQGTAKAWGVGNVIGRMFTSYDYDTILANIGDILIQIQSKDAKDSVRATTTANITLSGTQTIDGVVMIAGDRILVKNQTIASANGLYVVSAGSWARSTDADTSGKVTSGMSTRVSEGTLNGGSVWYLITADPITLGTTSLVFSGVLKPWGDNTFVNRSVIEYSGSAGQTISAATWTKVIFSALSIDNLSEFSASRFTAKTATGLYDLQGILNFSSGVSATNVISFATYKNGSLLHYLHQDFGTALPNPVINYADKVYLSPGDYVEVYINCSIDVVLAVGSFIRVIKEA